MRAAVLNLFGVSALAAALCMTSAGAFAFDDGRLMPARKGQAAPDLRHFLQ